jgi:hypothetical protein
MGSHQQTFPTVLATCLLLSLSGCGVAKLQRGLAKQNVPVKFYGQVTDQNGRPLSGAIVLSRVRHWSLTVEYSNFGRPVYFKAETDSDGRFFIHGISGDVLGIESIKKDGYELEPSRHGFNPSSGSLTNPVIFRMWPTDLHYQLITGHRSFHIVPDGRPYVVDLTKGTLAEQGAGDLKLWIKRPDVVEPGQDYDWSSEIDAINGGGLFEETNTTSSMYLAPQEGFAPKFRFHQQIIGNKSASTGTRRFYIKLNDGRAYGRVTIELIAPYNNRVPGMVHLDYTVNPSGSLILR